MSFKEKVAVITGSGRGIGKAIAIYFAKAGADVVINFFRNRGPAEETAEQIRDLGVQVEVVKANIGEKEGIDQLIGMTVEKFGGLDILICNAASGYNRPAMEQKIKGWDWTMNINARALLFLAQAAVPLMEKRGGGHIVSISSPGSSRVLPSYVMVGTSKAALEALTRYLAVELAPRNIVVNAVSPGIVETEALQHFEVLRERDVIPEVTAMIPAGRIVSPEDVAGVVGFLCSPAAEMIRGQTILVDGGYTLPIQGVDLEME
jgi:enoyl-[acyl-carrier protein] reductase III